MTETFTILGNLSPLAVIALLAYIIYLLISKHGPVRNISENHLHQLPDVVEALVRIEQLLGNVARDIAYVRGRLNGKG